VRIDLKIYICFAYGAGVMPLSTIGVIAHIALADGTLGIL